ncbi:MAG: aminoacyl-tRNA hydrolase [Patescibacteria group bacterium]|jgi:PTH1 family peptidyl-tRNA hydrolase
MLTIVGLGNWKEKYQETRHNIGFLVLDQLLPQISPNKGWQKNSQTGCLEARGEGFLLAKPQTFMNLSGQAVKELVDFYKLDINNLLLVNDDLDLGFGEIRIDKNRGSAGHRGVESVIEALGTKDFWRARVGIGRPEESEKEGKMADFVLEKFSQEERNSLKKVTEEVAKQLVLAIKNGTEKFRGTKTKVDSGQN